MNTNLLKGTIVSNGDSVKALAEALNLSYQATRLKILGELEFKQSEIAVIRARYGLSSTDVINIFFAG